MTNPHDEHENFSTAIPDGDDRERLVCRECGFINYQNPKIIAGSVVTFGDKILLCRRSIEPRKGKWTIPAGFLEVHETPAEGAMREAYEEATASIEILDLLAVYTVKRISQVHMMYRAKLLSDDIKPGIESLEVGLFTWEEIPWDDLAFPSVHWALGHFREVEGKAGFAPFTNPAEWADV
ncbi:NUDIX hydrolase [Kordiimonas sediminis]|uniref:NUDIX hydrolase n=1 Tax=Kordiimonas sediminis TaxID=1735581 RepID=A0A919E4Z3_9PROT|nr:NUDIX hydrolase [Kordiimonas sediminis]GHF14349.1 NUDIX hydrolase [Kordiimonas sediminis]